MTIRYDAATGTLEVDRADFQRIVSAVASSEPTSDPGNDPRVHPKVGVGLRTVVRHVCEVDVLLGTPETIQLHNGWVSEEAFALLLQTPTDLERFVVVDPPFLPAVLARLTLLGPRKTAEDRGTHEIPLSTATGLFAADQEQRAAAFADLPVAGVKRALRVECRWTGAHGSPSGRGIVAVDGDEGVWILEPGSGSATLTPGSSSVIWRAYTELLPEDAELGSDAGALGPDLTPSWTADA